MAYNYPEQQKLHYMVLYYLYLKVIQYNLMHQSRLNYFHYKTKFLIITYKFSHIHRIIQKQK